VTKPNPSLTDRLDALKMLDDFPSPTAMTGCAVWGT
jgi:hypothetical protein